MTPWPPSLQPIAKYFKRALEVERVDPLVAYYCNKYSLQRSMEIRDPSDENAIRFITGLLEKCDQQKNAIGPDDGTHRQHLEKFALNVFDMADNEDRTGVADKETAVKFFAAMCYLEVCTVLGPLSTELQNRMAYAKWKAGDIMKALRQGQAPVPGPSGGLENERIKLEEQGHHQAPPPQHHQQHQQQEYHYNPNQQGGPVQGMDGNHAYGDMYNAPGNNATDDDEEEDEIARLKRLHKEKTTEASAADANSAVVPFEQGHAAAAPSHDGYSYRPDGSHLNNSDNGANHHAYYGRHGHTAHEPHHHPGARPSMSVPGEHEYENEEDSYAPEKHHHLFEHEGGSRPGGGGSGSSIGQGSGYVSEQAVKQQIQHGNDIEPYASEPSEHAGLHHGMPPPAPALPSEPSFHMSQAMGEKFQKAMVVYDQDESGGGSPPNHKAQLQSSSSAAAAGPPQPQHPHQRQQQDEYYGNPHMMNQHQNQLHSSYADQYQHQYQSQHHGPPSEHAAQKHSSSQPQYPSQQHHSQKNLSQQQPPPPHSPQHSPPHSLKHHVHQSSHYSPETQPEPQRPGPPRMNTPPHRPNASNAIYPSSTGNTEGQEPAPSAAAKKAPLPKKRTGPPTVKNIIDAQRCTKNALSALDFRDFPTARENLMKALALIEE